MRRLVVAVALLVGSLPTTAWGQAPQACTETANLSWEVDHGTASVTTGVVELPGCEDGDVVGLQLDLEGFGWLPEDPIVAEVADERARFDLTTHDVGVRPVVGARVTLYGEAMAEVVEVLVDQQFVNAAGKPQRGLRTITELDVPIGEQYRVPEAPRRYATVPCAAVGISTEGTIGEEVGDFTARTAGRHVVCYQQQSGSPDDAPGEEDAEVLGVQLQRDPPVVIEGAGGPATGDRPLASTGVDLLRMALVALTLLVAGRWLTRRANRGKRGPAVP